MLRRIGCDVMSDLRFNIKIDYTKNQNISDFAMKKLEGRYLLEGETPQDMFARVACAFGDSYNHAQRIYNYISDGWFLPATPVLSNGGTDKGLPISCFLNECEDTLEGIANMWHENIWLSSSGGGIGSYYGNVRSIGETVGKVGTTSGVIPFMKVQDSLSLCISQGSQRSGASAAYISIDHPEIEEFLLIRRPTGGDHRRKAEYIHHGVVISDEFMQAVEEGKEFFLRSPKDGSIRKTVDARDLWQKLLIMRMETGEPYILYKDTVNRMKPECQKKLGLEVKTSNLCSEITLPTGTDHLGRRRTAVCCLSSLNLAKFDDYAEDYTFFEDVMRFLDNVLQSFIDKAPDTIKDARYSALRERSVGLGAMGYHTYLQKKGVGMGSLMATVHNKKIFSKIREHLDKANLVIAEYKGPCPDSYDAGMRHRFSNMLAIAPNASTSIITGVSPGIEPIASNIYMHKTDVGNVVVKNPQLVNLLQEKEMDTEETWRSIAAEQGSVQHLDFLTEIEKDVFKTAFEIDQKALVLQAGDRQEHICQAQSLNVFLPADVDKKILHRVHFDAWKAGVKSMYYLRSTTAKRAENITYTESDCVSCEG